MINYSIYNDNIVSHIDKFLLNYKNIDNLDDVDHLYVVSEECVADDQGGLDATGEQRANNSNIVGISPYCTEGSYFETFVASILIARNIDQIKKLCNLFPEKTIYYTMGISTFPVNDMLVSYDDIVRRLSALDCKNLHICFVNGWDMYTDKYKGFDRLEKIKRCFKEWGYDKLKFLMANNSIVEEYKMALPDSDVQYFTIYPLRIYDSPGKKNFPKSICEKTKNKLRFKKLICLNNYDKRHRSEIVDTIKPYEREIYYSYRSKGIFLNKDPIKKFAGSKDSKFLRNQDSPPYRLVSTSYAWLATETLFHSKESPTTGGGPWGWGDDPDQQYEVTGFFTEKTFKAFYFELPIFLVGLRDSYRHLQNIGFETFPEMFDESFDSIDDERQRMRRIKASLVEFLETPLKEIDARFWMPIVQEKIKHNKDLITKMAWEDPFNIRAVKEKYGN